MATSRVAVWIDAELLHSGDQGRAVNTHPGGRAVFTSDLALAFGQGMDDGLTLLDVSLGSSRLAIESRKCLFDDARNVFAAAIDNGGTRWRGCGFPKFCQRSF